MSPLSSTSGAGFTLTRTDGWFDIMINGGGVVTLKFGKSPFLYQSKSISVPWNQVRTLAWPYIQKTCDVAEKAILAKKKLQKKCVNRDKIA